MFLYLGTTSPNGMCMDEMRCIPVILARGRLNPGEGGRGSRAGVWYFRIGILAQNSKIFAAFGRNQRGNPYFWYDKMRPRVGPP